MDIELAKRTYPRMLEIINQIGISNEKSTIIIITVTSDEILIDECHRTTKIFNDISEFTEESLREIYFDAAFEFSKMMGSLPIGRVYNHYIFSSKFLDCVSAI